MKIRIRCEDQYEAQKLASLIFIKDANETYITSILNVIQNEMVIALGDKSAHSILLHDEQNVEKFADFIQSVIEKKDILVSTDIINENLDIEKRSKD